MFPSDKKVAHNVERSRIQRVGSFDAAEPFTSGLVSGEPLQSARSDSVQEEGRVADFSEADRDGVEAREDFWSMSGEICLLPPCRA